MASREVKISYKQKLFIIRKLYQYDVNADYVKSLKSEKFIQSVSKNITISEQKKIINDVNKNKTTCILGFFYKKKLLGTSGYQKLNKKKVFMGIFLFDRRFIGKGYGKFFIWSACFFINKFFKKDIFVAGIMKSNFKSIKAFNGAGFKIFYKAKKSIRCCLKFKSRKNF